MPQGRALHIDTPLANFAVQAFQTAQEYVAPRLLPVVPVGKQSDKYYVLDRDSWLMLPSTTRRAPKTPPRRVDWKVSSDSYYADNYALANEVANEDLANADTALMFRQRSVEFVSEMLARDYENRTATLFTTAANFATGHVTSLSGAAQWSSVSSADVEGQVNSAHAAIRRDTGLRANTLIMDYDSYLLMTQNTRLMEKFKYTTLNGNLNDSMLGSILKVQNIVVADSIKNTAKLQAGTSVFSSTNIWGANAILCHMAPATTLKAMTFAAAFRWQPAGIPGPFEVYRYPHPDPGVKAEVNEVGYYQDEKVIAPALGYLIGSTR